MKSLIKTLTDRYSTLHAQAKALGKLGNVIAETLYPTIYFRFSAEIHSGLIEIVAPPKEFYPDLNNLPKDVTFHDPPLRVK